jgi:FkbM family methyltransferase
MNRTLKETLRRFLPRSLRPHRIRRGFLKDRIIFTSWRDYPGAIRGTTEEPLIDWFRGSVHAGETWLDVGAHYGYTALALAELVGPAGHVLAFEPVIASAGAIGITRQANHLSQLRIAPFALGSAAGLSTFDLPVYRGMADSTLHQGDWIEPLLVTSFDHVWPSLRPPGGRVHGVKIDVQGMEIEVLKGMRNMLERDHPKLVVEFHTGVDRRLALDLLASLGYDTTPHPVDGGTPTEIADDKSYAFLPELVGRAQLDTLINVLQRESTADRIEHHFSA